MVTYHKHRIIIVFTFYVTHAGKKPALATPLDGWKKSVMPGSHPKQAPPRNKESHIPSGPGKRIDKPREEGSESPLTHDLKGPDADEEPLGFLRLLIILIASHIGVRSRANREEDFRRANGLHVFIAGIIYFLLLIGLLILIVNNVAG